MSRVPQWMVVACSVAPLLFLNAVPAIAAQPFTWKGRAMVNNHRANSNHHRVWNRTSNGRLTLSQPTSAQGRQRLIPPTSAQGRLLLAPATSPNGRLQLQSPSNSSPSKQQHVERLVQEQLRRDQAERTRRQKIVERLLNKPAETIVVPLNTGKPEPVTVMPLNEKPAKAQPTTLAQFEESSSEEDKEKDD